MIISYEDFKEKLDQKIKTGEDFNLELLETVIANPRRYCGLFRLSNAKTKLIQNVTQSKEIKFGDFIEDLSTDYIQKIGYINKSKDLGTNEDGDRLSADQVFIDKNIIHLVEQKVRDDHDSTKKRGQYSNFCKKVFLIKKIYPGMHIHASMWFVDDGLKKNKNYYEKEMEKFKLENCELHLYYGGSFFQDLNNGKEVWDELINYLTQLRVENPNGIFTIPDFGSSQEMYKSLLNLPIKYWKKLESDKSEYKSLRKELFSSGSNLENARKNRR